MTAPEFIAPAQQPEAPEATATPDTKPAPELDGPYDPERALEKIRKANNEAEALRRRIKELEPLAAQGKELADAARDHEEKQKPEIQRLTERSTAAEREAEEARSETLRYRIALKHGISEDDFDLLGSGTEEQITARAEKVAAKNKAAADAALPPGTPAPRRPGEQLLPGATPAPAPTPVEDAYPSDWLSPTQRAAIQKRNSQ